MTADQIRARTLEIVQHHTSVGYSDGLTLGDRDMDSLDVVELELSIEDEWDITVPDLLWGCDTTVEKVVADTIRLVTANE